MRSIVQNTGSTLRERGSKFYGFLFKCEDEESFQYELGLIKGKYPDATHHCWAYRIDPNTITEFSSDNGEPSGTAGLPILNQLKSFELINTGLVVVRYYGGTKLGKSGLIQTYGETARLCIEEAILTQIVPVILFEIHYPYPQENVINKLRLNYDLIEQDARYLADVTLTIACLREFAEAFESELSKLEHLDITFEKGEHTFIVK